MIIEPSTGRRLFPLGAVHPRIAVAVFAVLAAAAIHLVCWSIIT
ncbi:hypothetical protein [Novosphingobium mangrovi (ex Huang et al. 2023)]|uniref:Light-harvesting protein n=1 Tax=Novosphingobium mangrovi (ex Huang et al. 2023) TaxID=2976432 RepID=A0ABT2I112_9SPHN|nr:hypothetical protein [Novosphingobium mangrovi (ex Huang et al. 2023)]MCT2398495.1 hypothetical protein [Novosphingobium mangrovi (ex Huang et al. 2023)]